MRRTLGLVFMVVGVVGIVASLLLIPAVWIGRGVANQEVAELISQVSEPLQQLQSTGIEYRANLGAVRGGVDQAVGQIDAVVGQGALETRLADRLLEAIDQTIGPAYGRLREAYIGLRERAAAATQAAAAIQRLVPGLALPTLPTEELAALDTQLQGMDAALRELRVSLAAGALPDTVPGIDRLRRAGQDLHALNTRLDALATTADKLSARVLQLEVALTQAQATLDRIITGVAVGLSVVLVYIGLLHAALFAYGQRLRAALVAPSAPASPPVATRAESTPAPQPTGVGT